MTPGPLLSLSLDPIWIQSVTPAARRSKETPHAAAHRRWSRPSPWVELVATDADWDAADADLLTSMLGQLVLIRAFEEYVLELAGAGLIHGPAHSSIGQEGGAVGSVLALTSEDTVNGSHRGHHQFLAKALHHVAAQGHRPAEPLDRRGARRSLLRTPGRDLRPRPRASATAAAASMHLQWKEAGAMGTNAIVGGGVPQAAGFAWAHRQAGTDAVVGDLLRRRRRSTSARRWRRSTSPRPGSCRSASSSRTTSTPSPPPSSEATGEPRLSGARPRLRHPPAGRSTGWTRWPSTWRCRRRSTHMRAGNGPTVVEADVYRYFHQNGAFPGSAFGYRTKEEEAGVAGSATRSTSCARTSPGAASSAERRASTARSPRPRR